jgi:uncharacterized membrane protein
MTAIKGGVVLSGILLAAGLALHVAGNATLSAPLLAAGLILLMTLPATRVVIAIVERMRERDWPFVLVTALVLVELAITLVLATRRI